nr:AAA family ATPase [Nanoarchaeota archaeon]
MTNMLKQEKLLRIYNYIKDNLYFCNGDLCIGKDYFSSTLLFGLLTSVNKGKQLLMGEYGGGKTTSSEHLLSIVYGIPQRVLVSSTIKGNPELTLEKLTGRPNLGELNKGNEKVIWSLFVTLEPKIIDEFNRIPEAKQNLLLEGIDRGNWQYLNEMIPTGDFSLFATVNYKDSGNVTLVAAVVDRFEIAVESRHPGVNNSRLIRHKQYIAKGITSDKQIENEMYNVLLQDKPYAEKKRDIQVLQDKFKKELESRTGLELLSTQELEKANNEIREMPLSREADLFLDMLVSELYSCRMFGQKRSNEECVSNCHYQNLLCGKKEDCDSVRNQFAELKYSKSLAWLFGESEVSTKHIVTVLPYLLWHKVTFVDSYEKKFEKDTRKDPLQLHITKKAVNEMVNRFSKLKNEQYKMAQLIKNHKPDEAKKLAEE